MGGPRRRTRRLGGIGEWTPEERAAWELPENLTVSEHADRYRVLDQRSAVPGPWRTDRTPYLREILDRFTEDGIEEIVLCTGTQVGKSEVLNNCLLYVVNQDPSPAMMVIPRAEDGQWIATNRIKPMIAGCPRALERWDERSGEKLEWQFWGMSFTLSGANSAASLASKPIRFLFLDEVDKYPPFLGAEGDPVSLAKERLKSFTGISKCVMSSTPTLESGAIWRHLRASDGQRRYVVPCPRCGAFQELLWERVKWPEDLTERLREARGDEAKIRAITQRVRDAAWYECGACGGVVEDDPGVRMEMLRAGRWEFVRPPEGPVRRIAYHLSSLYSPWLSWGQCAAEFLQSKDFPEKLRNFVNSWLAEPWVDASSNREIEDVLRKTGGNRRGEVPREAQLLTAGVDVQQDHFWYEVRAWGTGSRSWLVEYGRAETWREVEEAVVRRRYGDRLVNLALLDSGYRTDEVYQFASAFPEVCRPCKGASVAQKAPIVVSSIDRGRYGSLGLAVVDTVYFKNFISGRLKLPSDGPGAWTVFEGCPPEYAAHICSERLVEHQDRKTGKWVQEWRPTASHPLNHLWDCAVYSAAAAELLGVRYLQAQEEGAQPEERLREPEAMPGTRRPEAPAPRRPWVDARGWMRR